MAHHVGEREHVQSALRSACCEAAPGCIQRNYGFQNRAMLAAQSEVIRTLAAAVNRSQFDADELVARIDETVRRTIADATVNVDVSVARSGEYV
ncbi:hypothetical protein A8926_8048 [Saccharopolyspora spinosa]|uniref:Uncharacterized protein n=2 Tax=Saccharopolyspora spinosa TaxID=60894 RepID=A0A2N3YAB2_SACSN|nr:hypothetical protein A8926_8048 [Saccharopolyspora spinosa]